MQFEIISDPVRLAALRGQWRRLANATPMQSLEWLATWWDSNSRASRELFVVVGRDNCELIGVAPWYIDIQRTRRVVRWLGDGPVCSDHATLLCQPADAQQFAQALGDWLTSSTHDRWHELQLEAIDADDASCRHLIDHLVAAGCPQVETPQPGSCYVELPTTYDEYLMAISKNHRKRCRRWGK